MGPSATYGSFTRDDQSGLNPTAFGISGLEGRSLDPQQKLVLHVGYSVFGRGHSCFAGATNGSTRGLLTYADVCVSVGVEGSGLYGREEDLNVYSASGGALSITSGRLSYTLGLVGPCYSIDVACASSLAALHVCSGAIVGAGPGREGVAIGTKVLSEAINMATSMGGMTSPRGRCHTFDQRADGYCRGEGCGAFLLSSRCAGEVALMGSAVQQDGPSASLTAPNGSSQRRLIKAVQDDGGAAAVRCLEAHGTGTALGDPIEVCLFLWLAGRGIRG